MPAASFARYLARAGLAAAAVLLAAWAYVVMAPMAFMDGGYPAWVAKTAMLRDCRLGRVAFFGDSRREGGIVPAALPVEASNFALAAGTAIEAESAVRRALQCGVVPDQVVISLTAEHFGPLGRFFWIDTLSYGFLSPGELRDVEPIAARLGDTLSLTDTKTADGLAGPLRDWLYASHFPSIYFSSLVRARGFGRLGTNQARLAEVLRSRGFSSYGAQFAPPAEAGEAGERPAGFAVTPLQGEYFERTLRRLHDRGVPVGLLVLPFKQAGPRNAALEAGYLDYLRSMAARFPNVSLINAGIAHWPPTLFADAAHLTEAGALLFTRRVAACMDGARIRPGCDFDWRPDEVAATAMPDAAVPGTATR